jgi:predicted dehydrogenase
MKPVSAVLIGAGDRGMDSYATYALVNPHQLLFTAVAEPNRTKLALFSELHKIPKKYQFHDWRELVARPQLAQAALICTQDKLHFMPAIEALQKGYYVVLEKPMSTDPAECQVLSEYSKQFENQLIVCYVLRYTNFFATIYSLLDEGRIGRLISIQHAENVPLVDQAHSFVRGNWRRAESSCPMILAHCCHDLDLLYWFAGSQCAKVSSFGSLSHFCSQAAPPGAPSRCLDGCSYSEECPYFAPKVYLTEDTGWPASVISVDSNFDARFAALKDGPYGRCVYHCDNDVVDNQVACFEFANGITATFTMCPFNRDAGRTIKLMGTKGELRAAFAKNEIEIYEFSGGRTDLIKPPLSLRRYGGGDHGLMEHLVDSVRRGDNVQELTAARTALESHLMAFAAERSRIEERTICMNMYRNEIERSSNRYLQEQISKPESHSID